MERIRWSIWLSAALLVTVMASGAPGSARLLVINVSNQVINALPEEPDLAKHDSNYIYNLLNQTVVPHFDFDAMARLVLGRFWRDASSQQQQRFVDAFRTYLVRVYAVSLAKYDNQEIEYKSLHAPATANQVLVQTEIHREGEPPIAIDYRMHRKNDEWKVYDVVIEGVSLVASNRSSFAAEIQQGGIDKLTARLTQRNQRNDVPD